MAEMVKLDVHINIQGIFEKLIAGRKFCSCISWECEARNNKYSATHLRNAQNKHHYSWNGRVIIEFEMDGLRILLGLME